MSVLKWMKLASNTAIRSTGSWRTACSTQPSAHWIELLLAQSIPCSVVENVESIANSAIAEEYNAFSEVTTEDGGSMKFVRNPIADPELQETAAPTVGQHNREILQELGYSEAEITGFEKVASPPD